MTSNAHKLDLGFHSLKKFFSPQQWVAIQDALVGEEAAFFQETMAEIYNRIRTMPVTYEQDGKGRDAIVYLHYFTPSADVYVTELDMEDHVTQATAYVSLHGYYPELGYVHIPEYLAAGAELDLHWTPTRIADVL